jgi:hypothetical protein
MDDDALIQNQMDLSTDVMTAKKKPEKGQNASRKQAQAYF